MAVAAVLLMRRRLQVRWGKAGEGEVCLCNSRLAPVISFSHALRLKEGQLISARASQGFRSGEGEGVVVRRDAMLGNVLLASPSLLSFG